jgi:penicillin-binding protein 2
MTAGETETLQRQARYVVVSNTVAAVSSLLGIRLELRETSLQAHYLNQRFLPLPILTNCTPGQVAFITEQSWAIPGVTLEQIAVRSYPHGMLAAHALGHLSRDDNHDEEEDEITYHYRLPDYVGGIGLEKALDRELRGTAGAKAVQVNSSGYRHRQIEDVLIPPKPGLNVITTLDLSLQKVVEQALDTVKGGDERGAVVVMDPRNGDVLAIASAPSFNPSEFLSQIPQQRWDEFLNKEPERRMFNRATYGEYAPGSTFNVIHALAQLDSGLDPDEIYHVQPNPHDPGHGVYFLGRRPIKDTAPPGEYDFRKALIKSSNSYFIHYGLRLGWDKILSMGHRFGLGERTDIAIGEEKKGYFPTLELVRAKGLNDGNLANVCIGQEITVTPIQLAVAISAVANGGRVFYPRLVNRLEPYDLFSEGARQTVLPGQIRAEVQLPLRHYNTIREAMRDDVADSGGTGKASRVADFAVCGKTGTAQVTSNGRMDHITWFVSFAPFESPRYVVVVMIESGASGGGTCAPVARQIYKHLHETEVAIAKGGAVN